MKKPYRVRRTVDNSMRYFEASYLTKHLLHDEGDSDVQDPRSNKASTSPSSLQRQLSTRLPDNRRSSVRSNKRFHYDSAITSEDVDDVTNIKR